MTQRYHLPTPPSPAARGIGKIPRLPRPPPPPRGAPPRAPAPHGRGAPGPRRNCACRRARRRGWATPSHCPYSALPSRPRHRKNSEAPSPAPPTPRGAPARPGAPRKGRVGSPHPHPLFSHPCIAIFIFSQFWRRIEFAKYFVVGLGRRGASRCESTRLRVRVTWSASHQFKTARAPLAD